MLAISFCNFPAIIRCVECRVASSLMNDASIILMIMGHRCLEDLGLTESLVYIYTLSYGQVKTFNVSKTRPTTA